MKSERLAPSEAGRTWTWSSRGRVIERRVLSLEG
jgi:hypothetical protein